MRSGLINFDFALMLSFIGVVLGLFHYEASLSTHVAKISGGLNTSFSEHLGDPLAVAGFLSSQRRPRNEACFRVSAKTLSRAEGVLDCWPAAAYMSAVQPYASFSGGEIELKRLRSAG